MTRWLDNWINIWPFAAIKMRHQTLSKCVLIFLQILNKLSKTFHRFFFKFYQSVKILLDMRNSTGPVGTKFHILQIASLCTFLKKAIPDHFLCTFLSFLQLTVYVFIDWIQTADLWFRKQNLCQLPHNHCPNTVYFAMYVCCAIFL